MGEGDTNELPEGSILAARYARSLFDLKFALDTFVMAANLQDAGALEIAARDTENAWFLAIAQQDVVATFLMNVRRILIDKLTGVGLHPVAYGSSLHKLLSSLDALLGTTQEGSERGLQ